MVARLLQFIVRSLFVKGKKMPVDSLPKPASVAKVKASSDLPPNDDAPTLAAESFNVPSVTVEMPYLPKVVGINYQDESHRVDLGKLTREQLRKVKALRRGLVARGDRLADGREVKSNRDALLWAIDSLMI